MVVRRVILRARDVVFFKGVVEACDGLAGIHADQGGDLVVAAPAERMRELDAVLDDLCTELGAIRSDP